MDDRDRKDALLEALETILQESRRLRGEGPGDARQAGAGGDDGAPPKPEPQAASLRA